MKKTYILPIIKSVDLGVDGRVCDLVVGSDTTPANHDNNVKIDTEDDGDALSRDITNLWDKEW